MGFPLFRVTLNNDIEGSLVISEPGGWDDAKLKLERNMEFHSLVEFYDQPLMFYGEDNSNNGGLNYIRNIEQTQGIDAQITITIEVSHDEGDTYETVVENTLEIESVKETDFYKMEMGVIRNGFWQNFMNRKDTPVNLLSTTDLDGQIRDAINAITIQLPSQKMRQRTVAHLEISTALYSPWALTDFFQINVDTFVIDEVQTNHYTPIGKVSSLSSIFPAHTVLYSGSYRLQYSFECSIIFDIPTEARPPVAGSQIFYLKINDDTPIAFTETTTVVTGSQGYATYSLDQTVTLNAGDEIRIYSDTISTIAASHEFLFWGLSDYTSLSTSTTYSPFTGQLGSTIEITSDNVYIDTDCEGFFIHEAGNAITDRIIGRDGTFYSEYFGNTNTQIQNYAEDGCGSWYALTRGLNIRGYLLADKPFFMSFDTYWNGINPLFNLGLGYEVVDSLEVIRIEPKRYFYNPTTSINFDFVNNIERSYNPEFVFKAIEIGFEKWSAESASGVDDPQSKRVYTTRFKTVGKEIKILSKFIGASLAIEQTRRNRVEQGKDWRMDEDVMIIALNLNGGPEFQPELDENFTSITNLLNEETRYNIRLSVARNFERWKDFFNGCLQWYVGEDYKFASGEGNFDMTSTLDSGDCEANGTIDEKGDIEITDDFLFMPVVYTFEHPMTWEQYKTIRDNRNNAVGISRTDENHLSCFIMELEYQITHGKATFTVVLGEHNFL